MRRRVLITASALLVSLLSACGAVAGDEEPEIPPLTSEPGDPLPSAAPSSATAAQGSYPARVVLVRYLRGIAAGDRRVCAYLTSAFETKTFGRAGGCRTGIGQAKQSLRPQDITALRGVTVPAGSSGPGPAEFTVRHEDLRWTTTEPPQPGGLLAERYVLRRVAGRWLLAG